MSPSTEGGLALLGCLLGAIMYIGGPLLTGWICISVFGWPTWISIILALTVGGLVTHTLIMVVLLPILGVSSLMESRKSRDGTGKEPDA